MPQVVAGEDALQRRASRAQRALGAALLRMEGVMATKESARTKCTKSAGVRGKVIVQTRERTFEIQGLTSATGDEWVEVQCGSRKAYAPYRDFRGTGQDATQRLCDGGLVL